MMVKIEAKMIMQNGGEMVMKWKWNDGEMKVKWWCKMMVKWWHEMMARMMAIMVKMEAKWKQNDDEIIGWNDGETMVK